MKQEKWIAWMISALFIIIGGILYFTHNISQNDNPDGLITVENSPVSSGTALPQTQISDEEIAVYIFGEIKHAGVYRFTSKARVCDCIEAAGGFTKAADVSSVNQARYLTDGEQIEILSKKQAKDLKKKSGTDVVQDSVDSGDGLVNINQADQTALQTLPGIGASKAASIVEYRSQHGDFSSIDDLMKVPGIKEGVFNQLKKLITV